MSIATLQGVVTFTGNLWTQERRVVVLKDGLLYSLQIMISASRLLYDLQLMIRGTGAPCCHAGDLSLSVCVCVVMAGSTCPHWLLNVQQVCSSTVQLVWIWPGEAA